MIIPKPAIKVRGSIEGMRIEFLRQNNRVSMPINHAHDEYEICYFTAGERLYFLGDRTYHVKQGDILLINPDRIHKAIPPSLPSYERYLIYLNKHFIKSLPCPFVFIENCFYRGLPIIRLTNEQQVVLEDILDRLLHEAKIKSHGYHSYINSLFAQIFITLNRTKKEDDTFAFTYEHRADNTIIAIVNYINQNYTSGITLTQLTQHFNLSETHLTRSFKKATGFTIIEYLNAMRLKEARKLLRETSLPISRIRSKVGFGSLTHFERLFKNATNKTPSKYRKLHSHNQNT